MVQVLILADRATQQQLEEFFLRREYGVELCDSAAAARAAVDSRSYPFVVLDLAGDPEAALEICRRIRARPDSRATYILTLPAEETPRAMRAALAAGADDYLLKPIREAALQLRLAIGQRRLASRTGAGERLERSERRYRTLAATMNEGFFQVDERGIIEFANSRLSEITGYTQDELVGERADDLLVADAVRRRLPGQTLLGIGTGSESYSIPLQAKSGEELWVNLTAAPLPSVESRGHGTVGLVEDVSDQRSAEEGMRHREEYFRVLMENASDLITLIDPDGRILYQSRSSEPLLGWKAAELVGRDFGDFLPEEDRERFAATLEAAAGEAGGSAKVELRFRHRSGNWRTLESLCNNLVDNPVVGGVALTSRDMTEHRRVEAALKRERAFFEQLFRNSPSGIVILDRSERVVDVNRAFVDLFQYEVAELAGKPLHDFIVPDDLRDEAGQLSELVTAHQSVERETVRRRKDGTRVDVAILAYPIELQGRRIGGFGLYNDITERKKAERKLFYDAFHDSLTGLPNRTLLTERLERDLRRARRRPDYQFALLFLDLDRFKAINDNLGHAAGDELLKEVAERLQECLRPGDTTARLGGDEFTVILEDIPNSFEAARIAERMLAALARPFVLGGQEQLTSVSIGIAFSSTGYTRVDDLMRDADLAMYRAKSRGRGCYEIFDSDMHSSEVERLRLQRELTTALAEDQLVLYYQPLIALSTGSIVGFEALVRWLHPQRGLRLPAELIPACRETGLVAIVGRWVLAEACRQLVAWQRRFPGSDAVQASVNLSLDEVTDPFFLEELDRIVGETGVKPATLSLEFAEEVTAIDGAAHLMWEIDRRGFRLAIDDFGTGRTSLDALHRLPISSIKVDRSFVELMHPGGSEAEVVRAAAALGASLGLGVVAEGVESAEQLERLRALGVGFAQGYLFSPPLPAAEAEVLIAEDRRW